jgi:EAL domain-containing protein (putative c-di-GMP-specific phosphodiesterase class I)
LKIERAFVAGITEGPEEAALAQALVKLASVLKLSAVAEGIETAEQLDKLKKLGCGTGQGFLFAKPLEAEELHRWLADWRGSKILTPSPPDDGEEINAPERSHAAAAS